MNPFASWTPEMAAAFNARRERRKHELSPPPQPTDQPQPTIQPRPTTDEDRLNKTERAFRAFLLAQGVEELKVQAITLKLADDCRYTPDLFCVWNGRLTFWEVKGFMRDDAAVKIRVAARLNRWADFVLVYRKNGTWRFVPVKP